MGEQKTATKTPVKEIDLFVVFHQARPDMSVKSLSLLMAQWALETGRGVKCMNYNIGNFKAHGGNDFTYFATWEQLPKAKADEYLAHSTLDAPCEFVKELPSGNVVVGFKPCHPVAKFAAYATLTDGAADYLNELKSRFESAWRGVVNEDPHAFLNGLLSEHYFTGSALLYADGIYKLSREYQKRFSSR